MNQGLGEYLRIFLSRRIFKDKEITICERLYGFGTEIYRELWHKSTGVVLNEEEIDILVKKVGHFRVENIADKPLFIAGYEANRNGVCIVLKRTFGKFPRS